jgi:large subunit ribosomal protein L20
MRVTSPRLRRHKKILKLASGYRMTKNRLYKVAREAVIHAGQYAFAGRHLKRRDFRSTWITRINAALKTLDISYSKFIDAAKKKNIQIDRKILAELAVNQPKVFNEIVKKAGFAFTEK